MCATVTTSALSQAHPQSPLRDAITAAYRASESECVAGLLDAARLPPAQAHEAQALARRLSQRLRERRGGIGRTGLVQGLMQEFSLSSQEGVALMCLAEALLRIPDDATRDALIRDKLAGGNWQAHLGASPSLFVHAATWGLIITGKLVATHPESGLANSLARAIARSGEPVIRKGVDMAMRLLGEQFVAGESIEQALANARRREAQGFRHSYDMLGEAALTEDDALRYFASYEQAIHAIGASAAGLGVHRGPGISIKLSALHPRYCRAQYERVLAELYPRLRDLARLARRHDIGVNVDAEEAERLDLSLDLLERLCFEPELEGWDGVGFVVQAYQKRCTPVIDFLVDLAVRSRRRLMVRLVKGAYWDSEIKRAQVDGHEDYPVYTRKVHTDVSFLACARRMLAAPRAIYPQFATHNARSVAAILQMAGPECPENRYEFQCLHGMGEPLFEQVIRGVEHGGPGRPCRIYAPVGTHATLLAYLVRRLLENGANTSFVNRIADESVALDDLVADPVEAVERNARIEGAVGLPHPAIVLPRDLHAPERTNSAGIDLTDERQLAALAAQLARSAERELVAAPIVDGDERADGEARVLRNPADRREAIGRVIEASASDVADALGAAVRGAKRWAETPVAVRTAALDLAADRLQARLADFTDLLVREAGKTYASAIGEVREAVDFLRYYAARMRTGAAEAGGEPIGPVACISPWNFPLSILVGQAAAALAAGNVVLAKPAEQTPLVAAQLVRLLQESGVDAGALQLLPGRGETVGAALVADPRIRGVVFTGSTQVARSIARSLAGRLDAHGQPIPLIAETGGVNAMIVDSSALAEQAVVDILASAFDSAGQRCSALRVLCVQEEAADRLLAMLRGAMRELRVGRPDRLDTDVGPVIDADARDALFGYLDEVRAQVRIGGAVSEGHEHGHFVAPALVELPALEALRNEVFGPVLHVVRYRRDELPALVDTIDRVGYGLTLGVQTRIDEVVELIAARARVGNQYVNRNMIGAVVGVQPFGGEGLSGTGPKAGGPLYLRRLLRLPLDAAMSLPPAQGGPGLPGGAHLEHRAAALAVLEVLDGWLRASNDGHLRALGDTCAALARDTPLALPRVLDGPTGERNTWWLASRRAVLGVANDDADRLFQFAHALAAGTTMHWLHDDAGARALHAALPPSLRAQVQWVDDVQASRFDAAIVHGTGDEIRRWSVRLAQRDGPIVQLLACATGDRRHGAIALERLFVERTLSVNTAAAGGNTSLTTIG